MSAVSGCVTPGPGQSPASPAAAAVTIASAPGERTAFDPADVAIQAAGPIALTFRNDSILAHNLVFTGGLTAATRTIVEPGTSDQILLMPAGPGTYPFVCTIHDGMAGTLIVQAVAPMAQMGSF